MNPIKYQKNSIKIIHHYGQSKISFRKMKLTLTNINDYSEKK